MSHHRYHSSAPLGIKVLSVMVAIDGAGSVYDAVRLLGQGGLVIALAVALVGLLQLALSFGLWQMEPYAYGLGLAVFGVDALLDLLTGNLASAILTGFTISMLYHYRGLFRE